MGMVDGHCDTVVKAFERNVPLFENNGHVDLKRLLEFGSPVQFFAVWLEKSYYPISLRQTLKYIDYYYQELKENEGCIGHVNTFADILKNKEQGKISGLLSIEGGEALEGELSTLRMLYTLGVRAMGLTWNYRNQLADGVGELETGGGLTRFGKEVVKEMNRLGMVVDVSHLSETGFWDVDGIATKPYIASHSNAKSICDAPRNLSDDQIRAISSRGGVIGINLYSGFLTNGKEAHMQDILAHIHHIIQIGGDQCLGLGCDFDGIDAMPIEIKDVSDIKRLLETVSQQFGYETAEWIAEKNFLRVLKNILS